MKLVGHAAVFNSRSVDLGGFREIIAPGAFSRTLRDGHPVFAVHHHNMGNILGSSRSKTLVLAEDSKGLHFELRLPESSLGRDIHELVKRGDLAQMSFTFRVNGSNGEHWRELSGGEVERTLKDVDLIEISTVALPAYKASSVSARSLPVTDPDHSITSSIGSAANAARNRMTRRYLATRLRAA